jgi:hypothetical protein
MIFLTSDQHCKVLRRLVDVGRQCTNSVSLHPTGLEYTSLMSCFLLQNISAADTILRTCISFGKDWYPVNIGYAIARTMFEINVTAHYVSVSPADRAKQYISFAAVLNKREMDACKSHCNSTNSQWREAMTLQWQHYWASRENSIVEKYNTVAPSFMRKNKNGKMVLFKNWAGKSIRDMAAEVDHLEAYDIFYSELSSFAHADVHLADRYLKLGVDGPFWSQRAREDDVGNVFRHAAFFMTCYLELFGKQFGSCTEAGINECWQFRTNPMID